MKRTMSIISAGVVLSAIAAMPLSADAAESTNTSNYIQSIRPETYALTAEEAASGEAVIHTEVYLKGCTNDRITINTAQCQILGDESNYTYMRNIVDPSRTSDEKTYSYLGGEFTTSYRPFCFGKVSDGTYSTSTFLAQVRDYCMERVNGNEIYYNGNDTIKFRLPGRNYVDANGNLAQDNVSHEIICPLTINEDGSATYSFLYADVYYDHAEVATSTGVIPYYQPELLSVGDMIPEYNNLLSWIGASTGSKFLGNSDDFPFLETDLRFKKGTPCGIYNITSNQEYCNVSVTENGTSCKLPLEYHDAAIAVGVKSAEISSGEFPVYSCFYSHDNKIITAASAGYESLYTCDVAYTDGTSESGIDVSGAVNAAASPKELWENAGSNYFIDDITMYCGDTPITFNGDTIKQKALVGVKGDANLDGAVGIDDAAAVLSYYAQTAAGMETSLTEDSESFDETLAYFLADIDTQSQIKQDGGAINIGDAANILKYYASTAAGITVSWDEFIY